MPVQVNSQTNKCSALTTDKQISCRTFMSRDILIANKSPAGHPSLVVSISQKQAFLQDLKSYNIYIRDILISGRTLNLLYHALHIRIYPRLACSSKLVCMRLISKMDLSGHNFPVKVDLVCVAMTLADCIMATVPHVLLHSFQVSHI